MSKEVKDVMAESIALPSLQDYQHHINFVLNACLLNLPYHHISPKKNDIFEDACKRFTTIKTYSKVH